MADKKKKKSFFSKIKSSIMGGKNTGNKDAQTKKTWEAAGKNKGDHKHKKQLDRLTAKYGDKFKDTSQGKYLAGLLDNISVNKGGNRGKEYSDFYNSGNAEADAYRKELSGLSSFPIYQPNRVDRIKGVNNELARKGLSDEGYFKYGQFLREQNPTAYDKARPFSSGAFAEKILGNLVSAGTPIGLASSLARNIWNSGAGQNVRGMATDTIKNPIMSGINNAGEITGDVIEKLQSKFNNWNVSQGKKANPDFIPKKRVGPNIFDVSGEVEDKGVSNYFDIAAENAAIDPTKAGRRSDNVSAGPYDSGFEIMNLKDSGVSAGPYDSGFATTEEVVEPLAELSENERIIQDYEQEFLDTYGVPMQGNKEVASLEEPGTKIYGLGDPNTRSAMLTRNNLRNYEFGKIPDINPLTGLPYGYDDDIFVSDDIFSDTISDMPALGKEIRTFPQFQADGGYMSNFPNQNMGTQSLTASDNIDDRIMKNLQYEKMAPGMMGYNQGGKAMGIYEKLKSFNDHG
tara:strand:- start:38 stop:1579 length:1542 start_codon:yes stop_codon:yes gene_type:complete